MKKLFSLFISVLCLTAIQATACPRNANRLICTGDVVYPHDFEKAFAIVKGINPVNGKVVVKDDYSHALITYSKEELFISYGCIESVCVGDVVFPTSFLKGYATVRGVNPYKQTVMVQGSYYNELSIYTLRDIGVSRGCYSGVCVGDVVFPHNFTEGYADVVAINFATGKITVKSSYDRGLYLYKVEELALGDYCSKYGEYERSVQAYPQDSNPDYLIPSLKFKIKK